MTALRTPVCSLLLLALSAAAAAGDAEGCKDPAWLRRIAGCVIAACVAKDRDTITLQISAQKKQSLDAAIDSVTYSCPAWLSPQDAVRDLDRKLRAAFYQIVFEDTQEPMSAEVTARKGTQWIHLNSGAGDHGTTYSVAVAETAPKNELDQPGPVESPPKTTKPPATSAATVAHLEPPKRPERPAPTPAPAAIASAVAPDPTPNVPSTPTIPRGLGNPVGPVSPPKVLTQARMEVPSSLRKTILGEVLITVNVEIDENGQVTKAVLAGKITKNIEKLESAALDAVSRSKFEPARQGDHPVAGHTTLKLHFEGEPIRANLPSIH
jgi:TonB family protein